MGVLSLVKSVKDFSAVSTHPPCAASRTKAAWVTVNRTLAVEASFVPSASSGRAASPHRHQEPRRVAKTHTRNESPKGIKKPATVALRNTADPKLAIVHVSSEVIEPTRVAVRERRRRTKPARSAAHFLVRRAQPPRWWGRRGQSDGRGASPPTRVLSRAVRRGHFLICVESSWCVHLGWVPVLWVRGRPLPLGAFCLHASLVVSTFCGKSSAVGCCGAGDVARALRIGGGLGFFGRPSFATSALRWRGHFVAGKLAGFFRFARFPVLVDGANSMHTVCTVIYY